MHTRRFTNDMANKYHHLWRILVNQNAYLNDQFGPIFWMTSADIRACLLRMPYLRTYGVGSASLVLRPSLSFLISILHPTYKKGVLLSLTIFIQIEEGKEAKAHPKWPNQHHPRKSRGVKLKHNERSVATSGFCRACC